MQFFTTIISALAVTLPLAATAPVSDAAAPRSNAAVSADALVSQPVAHLSLEEFADTLETALADVKHGIEVKAQASGASNNLEARQPGGTTCTFFGEGACWGSVMSPVPCPWPWSNC